MPYFICVLTNYKINNLNSTVETYHIWLCCIATDEILKKKQKENEILQPKIKSLSLQLMEREEKFDQLMENMKGKQLPDILLYQIICLVLQCQVVQLDDQIKSDDPQLSQKFEEVIDDHQELRGNR